MTPVPPPPHDHPAIAWPVLVIARDDRFMHVLDERGLEIHHQGPWAQAARTTGPAIVEDEPAPVVPVDFFDRDRRRLRPLLNSEFAFLGLETGSQVMDEEVLLARLDRAVGWALGELATRDVEVVDPPAPPEGRYGRYLDDLARVFAALPDTGSAWHNFVHLIT